MDREALKARTKSFALRTMRLVDALPEDRKSAAVGNQLLRSATSVGANYRAACRGRSKKEFIAKLGIALEEADESAYWLELISESGLLKDSQTADLTGEADELCAIIFSAIRTSKETQ